MVQAWGFNLGFVTFIAVTVSLWDTLNIVIFLCRREAEFL